VLFRSGCGNITLESKYHKSVRLDDIKSKGVIIDMSNHTDLQIVIKTDSSIVKESITQEEYNYLGRYDTIR